MKKKGYRLIHVIIIIIITSIISGVTVGVIITKSLISNEGVNYTKYATDKNVQSFLDVYAEITDGYYEDVNKEEIITSAIDGMMDYLNESYTTYLDSTQADDLYTQLNGTYNGIGITFKAGVIMSVLDNSPAEEVGILEGDRIISVNDINIEGKTGDEIAELVRSNSDDVVLAVERNGEYLTFNLKTRSLSVPSTEYRMLDNSNIGYLKMSVFSKNLTNEVKSALTKLENAGMEELIIDLRNNTGGYLEQAYSIATIFLNKGSVVYSLESKEGTVKYKDKDDSSKNYPIAIITNNSTASAAEILTAALKDSYDATIVGLPTYGKGKVQQTYSLDNGGLVKYTSSKWLRPNGLCVDKVGIIPDYVVENEYTYDDTDPDNIIVTGIIDNQLNKAIELLSI